MDWIGYQYTSAVCAWRMKALDLLRRVPVIDRVGLFKSQQLI